MPWRYVVLIIILLLAFFTSGFISLIDNTCTNDRVSLEKRCQIAIEHYRG